MAPEKKLEIYRRVLAEYEAAGDEEHAAIQRRMIARAERELADGKR